MRWLRVSYLAGALADAAVAVLILVPSRMGEITITYSMGLAASLMFGWTGLLLWANAEPMERKGVLLLTIFPVITGLLSAGVWAVMDGRLPVERIIPSTLVGIGLIFLMGYSYLTALSTEKRGESPHTATEN